MTLLATERLRLTGRWRQLAQAANAGDGQALGGLAPDALKWASPLDAKAPAFSLFALARLAFGYARATRAERVEMTGALLLLADLALALLGPPPEPAAPALPFRADLDG